MSEDKPTTPEEEKPTEERASLKVANGWMNEALGGSSTSSGLSVDANSALTFSAIYSAVRVLAESIAALPLQVFRRLPNGDKELAISSPMYRLLHDTPSKEQSAFSFQETIMGHVLLWGNGYAELLRNGAGQVVEMYPIRPDRVTVHRINGEIAYVYNNDRAIPVSDVLHIAGIGFDGLQGYSPIRLFREAIGLGLAAEEFGASFFGNASRPSGVMSHPGQLSKEAADRLRQSWDTLHKGANAAGRVAILEEGMKWQSIGIPPEDAQFLQTRKFQITEVARIYRVPPHMLGDLDRATFSNIEAQQLSFYQDSLLPWLVKWEQEINRKIFNGRSNLFAEHNVKGLLRGDTVSRFNSYKVARDAGFMSVNEIRRLENLNSIGVEGDIYLQPLNFTSVGDVDVDDADEPEVTETVERDYSPLFADAAVRAMKVEAAALTRSITKYLDKGDDGAAFLEWADDFYRNRYQRLMTESFTVLVDALATAQDGSDIVAGMCIEMGNEALEQIRAIVAVSATSQEASEQLRELIDNWMVSLPGDTADRFKTIIQTTRGDT